MKNIIFVTSILLSVASYGQSVIGIFGGISKANIRSTNFLEDNNSRKGFYGGLTYEYFVKDDYSISIDLVINQRGFTNDIIFTDNQGSPTGQRETSEFNYNYLSLPIKTGVYIGKQLSVFGNIGIVPSYLIKAVTILPAFEDAGQYYEAQTIDITDRVSKFDIAGLLEAGLDYKVKDKYRLFITMTYQYSFSSITNEDYFNDSQIKHFGLAISFGVKYKLGKA